MDGAFGNNFNSFGQQSYNQFGNDTNVILVTSLEEAIMRSTRPGSERVYFHQSSPTFYRVKVEYDGRKSYQEFSYSVPDTAATAPVTRADLQSIIQRLDALEGKVIGEVVNVNEKPNG